VPALAAEFEFGGFSAPHLEHTRASGAPHLPQNFTATGFSKSHTRQSIGSPKTISEHDLAQA